MIANCNVQLETKGGGNTFLDSIGRMFGGESFFMNTYTAGPKGEACAPQRHALGSGQLQPLTKVLHVPLWTPGGWVSMGPGCPGDIKSMAIEPNRELFIQGGCFLASTLNVKTDAKFQGLKGFISGNGLFFLRVTVEDGQEGKVI